jgi:Xaa-Pro dipeptidase
VPRGPSIIPDFERPIERLSTSGTISPVARDSDIRSLEELPARLAGEYGAHLAIMEQRLSDALATQGFDGAVIFAGDEKIVFRDDRTYPFQVEPYFKAWVPLTQAPGSFLRVAPGQRPMLVYKQVDDYWYEPPSDPEGYWTSYFDIRVVRTDGEARKLSGTGPRWVAIGETADATKPRPPSVNDRRVLRHLDYFRAIKTRYEILCMRGAQTMAVRGHVAVASQFRVGVSELELCQTYCGAAQQRETELPYAPIIGINEHAATLHYQHLRAKAPGMARSLLIDAGAQFNGYAADVTRTHSAAKDDFAALIASMEQLQQQVCGAVRAGIDFVELDLFTHRLLGLVLRNHSITKCSAEDAVASGITRAFLPHGLGHLLGLQVHDAGGRQVDPDGKLREPPEDRPYLRLTRVLEPGFVVTIEPGLYFIPALLKPLLEKQSDKLNLSIIERLIPLGGIRIEDDVEVTAEGIKNLTREAFAAIPPAWRG